MRRTRLDGPEVVAQVGIAIRELDAALAAFGFCALSLRQVAYLKAMYEASQPVSVAV